MEPANVGEEKLVAKSDCSLENLREAGLRISGEHKVKKQFRHSLARYLVRGMLMLFVITCRTHMQYI